MPPHHHSYMFCYNHKKDWCPNQYQDLDLGRIFTADFSYNTKLFRFKKILLGLLLSFFIWKILFFILFFLHCSPLIVIHFFFFLVKIFLGIHISWGTLITVVVGCWRSYFSLSMYEAWVSIEEGSRNRESRSGLRVEGNDYPVIYYERRDVSRIKNRARTYIHPGYSSDIHSEPDEGPTKEQVRTPGILHGHPLS